MAFRVIESKDNKTYKELVNLKKGNAKEGLFIVEGRDLVEEAMRDNLLEALIVVDGTSCPKMDVPIYGLKQGLYRELSSYQSLPEMMGVCRMKMADLSSLGERVIYLDKIQDPGNAGTMIRTALSFGYSSVVLSKDSVSLYNSKTIQSTKGALFHLPVLREDLIALKERGYNIYLTTLDGVDESTISELKTPFVLCFGNEGQGISKQNLNLGSKLRIEMSGIDSLNVAVAAGIFMYRFKKGGNK